MQVLNPTESKVLASFEIDLCLSDLTFYGDSLLLIGFKLAGVFSNSSIMSVFSLPKPSPIRTISNSFLKFLRTKFSFYLLFSFIKASLSLSFSEISLPSLLSLIFSFLEFFSKLPDLGEVALLERFEYISEIDYPPFFVVFG